MTGPIIFISHLRIQPEMLDDYRRMVADWVPRIRASKPRTTGFLHFLDRERSRVTIVHLFEDAEAMDGHFEGADERGAEAWRVLLPESWEIHGPASEAAVSSMRKLAESAGATLTFQPEFVAGFLAPTGTST